MTEADHQDSPAEPATPTPAAHRGVVATLYRISTLVGQVDDPAAAMVRIVEELTALFRAESAVLALINPDNGALEIECSRGFPAEYHKAPIPPGVGLLGWCALHDRAVLCGDVLREPRYLPLRPATRAQMVVPLEIEGQLHGVVGLESDRLQAFNETDLQTLTLLTGEAASVLRRLWAIEHLRHKAGQLEVLSNIAQELAAKLQPAELMETVTRESHRLTHCRLAVLELYDAAQRQVRLQAVFPSGEHFASSAREWAIEDCLVGPAIATRKQLEYADVRQHDYEGLLDIPSRVQVVSALATPLFSENEVIGVLSVYTDRLHRFHNDERRLLRALANLTTVALQNASLYQRVFESEETLRQSERLTTLGLLAAEIAHETRNPLTVIRLLFGSLNLEFPADDPRTTDLAIIREKLDQLESFVTRVLHFGKAPESLHARWSLDDIIRETCLLLRLKLTQARIHLHYEPPATPIVVDCHKAQIQQVLLNVILNSTHAMPDGGAIAINCQRQQGAVHDSVVVDIRDTGHGIPETLRDRIFDSFLSGRPDGTGLGLAIAKRIMRGHHGDIEVTTTGPGGTTMRLSLPVAR